MTRAPPSRSRPGSEPRAIPNATCYCERTVDEALAHTARCIVSRDGEPSVKLGVARFVT